MYCQIIQANDAERRDMLGAHRRRRAREPFGVIEQSRFASGQRVVADADLTERGYECIALIERDAF